MREELRGREPRYADKKKKETFMAAFLDDVEPSSLYAQYWKGKEQQQEQKTFKYDGYD